MIKEQASTRKKAPNRSTQLIRVKSREKFRLERWMRTHHCKTFSQGIKMLLDKVEGN